MLYPHEVIEDVRSGNDIVSVVSGYVKLKQSGANYFGLCPFHQEKTPSFSVSADKQLYYCFGCGAGGNVLTFIMQLENINFLEALRMLADRIHYQLPDAEDSEELARQARIKQLLLEMHQKAARFFYDRLQGAEGRTAAAYLDRRGVTPKTRIKFGLGYAPGRRALSAYLAKEGYPGELLEQSGLCAAAKNGGHYDRFSERLMFPIFDVRGRVIAFGGRVLDGGDAKKYINSSDTPIFDKSNILYGIQLARQSKAKEFILVEGYMDVIALYQAGFPQAVAALGTSFNGGHARLLRKHCEGVTALFDSDAAGTKAVLRAIPILLAAGLRVKVLQVTGAKDPDEYIKTYGSENFTALLSSAQSHIHFQVNQMKGQYRLDDTGDRVAFTTEAAKIIAKAESAIERDAYEREVAALADISREVITAEVRRVSKAQRHSGPVRDRRAADYELQGQLKDKGALEAKKSIIYFAAVHEGVRRALAPILPPEELREPVFVKLLETIYAWRGGGQETHPAALVNLFENLQDQKLVSEIFSRTDGYENHSMLEKAINEMLRVVKSKYLDEIIPAAEPDMLKNCVEMKKNLNQLYITISDG